MLRKILFGAVALAGLMLVPNQSADAGWRRHARRGYYYGPVARRYYYAPGYDPAPVVYGPTYYSYGYPYGYYGNPGYYGGAYYGSGYGPGVTVVPPGYGYYVR